MEESLLQAAPFVALPVFIVVGTEIDNVFAWNVCRTAGRSKHLALHDGLNFAGNLNQELFPDSPRPSGVVGSFQQTFAAFAVYPFSN